MRYLIALTALAAALAVPVAATAGGWATVELEAMPSGVEAGDTWDARFTVLRHGVTPTDGAKPGVAIVDTATSQKETFAAAPAGETGVYEAAVVFPDAGSWRIEIDNGLVATGHGESATTAFGPVTITDGTGGVPGGGWNDGVLSPLPLAGVGLLLLLVLAAVAAVGIRRSRRLDPA
jgi:YtkA-like